MAELYDIETPAGLLRVPNRPRVGPITRMRWLKEPHRYLCYEDYYQGIAAKVSAYRPTMTRALWDWVRRNCQGDVRPALRVEIEDRKPVRGIRRHLFSGVLKLRLVPVMRFTDQSDAATFRLSFC